ncbi:MULTISPECIES: BREX-1 system phosphatase PglZ type A [unclassified Leuconostoc]|uniref:BREX-1 system phosphatase PglZ type A n=1 Tax=unclassified Leuconostoc TaxID=2685106 RepID=UPI001907D13E|nr:MULTISPECIES: BREX-1 system phosphatase PglZ type A [unclassified Leuconostoc]MBK0041595.1 BREX-1 system phosphatase PglZ type A [Leuconostoc sp. S51]MBK0050476.1 BREX-1 system phosphatase PglZ type A [Leuconostoc sp. S50]
MAAVSLQQIIDKLNSEFVIGERRLIFWYDAAQDFFDDIEEIASKLENAKLLIMPYNQQFKTKTIIERQQPNDSFLIYSPALKPTAKLNFLMDELEYSQEFTADRIAFISLELGIPEALRSIVEEHQIFFGNKERMQKLASLNLEYRDERDLILGMMAVLTNQKTADIETITRAVMDGSFDEDNKILAVLNKYDLLKHYWEEVNLHFGYQSETPNLMQFVSALVLNFTFFELSTEIPSSYKIYRVSRQSTVAVFMANYMNNKEYTARYDVLANAVYDYVRADKLFGKMSIDIIAKASSFRQFDERVLKWSIERLLAGDVTAKVNESSIEELTDERVKMHFGDFYSEDYHVLKHAAALLQNHNVSYGDIASMITAYKETGFNIDRHYRKFYQHLHAAKNRDQYDKLRQLIEETYVKYLANAITQWNKEFIFTDVNQSKLNLQRNFYQDYIANQTANTVVIISDAFRYEAALELADLLKFDTKNIVRVESALTGLPSITPFGMAQLLPHNSLSYDCDKKNIIVDNQFDTNNTENRAKILKTWNEKSVAIQFDVIKKMTQAELRDFRSNKEIIYIYHNQIDAVGDTQKTEDQVFEATRKAIDDIHDLIKRLAGSANIGNFFITADHGYIYREDKVDVSDKIELKLAKGEKPGQRYLISDYSYDEPGVTATKLGDILGNSDDRFVNYPKSINVFQGAGGGRNYVHGGSSLQEMMIPVIHVNVKRGKSTNKPAELRVLTPSNRITNLLTNIEFLQDEPISDVVKPNEYKVYFVSENNEIISNEVIIMANLKDNNVNNRRFRSSFTFKEQKYKRTDRFYMLIIDRTTGVEVQRNPYILDIALAGGFGFDI